MSEQKQKKTIMFLLFFVLFCFFDSAQAADNKIVRLTTGEWPPYFSEHSENFGIVPNIVTQAFAIEGYTVSYAFFPWKRSFELAKGCEWDGTAAWQRTQKRERDFYFSDPIISYQNVFFHRKDRDFDWKAITDLKGMRVGITRGYEYSPDFESEAAESNIPLIKSDSDLINLKLLLDGRIDLHPNAIRVGLELIQKYLTPEEAERLTYHPRVIYYPQLMLLFPKEKSGSRELVDVFNRGLAKLKASGKYQELISINPEKPQITVALSNWPPWKIIDNGRFSGIDIEILREIGKRLDIDFKFIECPWRRCSEMVKNGDADMITSYSRTTEREEFVYYIKPSYQTEKLAFFKKKGSRVSVTTYEDLFKYKIGTLKGNVFNNAFDSDSNLKKTEVSMEYQLPHMLFSDRVDLIAGSEISMEYYLSREGFDGKFETLPFCISGIEGYMAMSKKSWAINLQDRISSVLQQMIEQHEIQDLIDKYVKPIN